MDSMKDARNAEDCDNSLDYISEGRSTLFRWRQPYPRNLIISFQHALTVRIGASWFLVRIYISINWYRQSILSLIF